MCKVIQHLLAAALASSSSLFVSAVTVAPPATKIIYSTEDASSIEMSYDSLTETVSFLTHVKMGSYISLGFGHTMVQTEIILWSAPPESAGQTNELGTYYSVGHAKPLSQPELMSCYTWSYTVSSTDPNYVDFVTTRPLDCHVPDSYVI